MASTIRISVGELCSRTKHYVQRAAAKERIVVTYRGEGDCGVNSVFSDSGFPIFSTTDGREGTQTKMGEGYAGSCEARFCLRLSV